MKNNNRSLGVKIGIASVALMGMGVVGVASALSVIGAHFADDSQTKIQSMMSIPAIVIIVTTLVVGKLMESFSKKKITLVGILCFLIGGVGPMFVDNLNVILFLRGIVGIGIGVAQVSMTALAAENFEGEERAKVQGIVQASQMGALGVMSICGGFFAQIRWNYTFLVYLIGVISLFCVIFLIPDRKPVKIDEGGQRKKSKLTSACWGWVIVMFVSFIGIMVYSAYLSFLMAEKGIGTAADSGISLSLFAVAGIIVGAVYGRFAGLIKNKMIGLALIVMTLAYLIMINSNNVFLIHVGSFLTGWSLSMFMPAIFLNTGLSVDAFSAPMAISVVTMAQNLGQFACPYILNPISASAAMPNVKAFVLGAEIMAVMGLIMLIWGVRKDSVKKH